MKDVFLMLLILISKIVFAQNVVPNPGFEELTGCPVEDGELNNARPWINPTLASPDLYNICSNVEAASIPNNFNGMQEPHSGNSYAGIYTYSDFSPNIREYIQAQLLAPLKKNVLYRVSYFLSLGDFFLFATNCDLYLSDIAILRDDIFYFSCCQAQVSSFRPITTKGDWVLIKSDYKAMGGESYITIGNFSNDNRLFKSMQNSGIFNNGYYFIDDVSVVPILQTKRDVILCEGEVLALDITRTDANYLWQDSSVSPLKNISESGKYWVETSFNDSIRIDTYQVDFIDIPKIDLGQDRIICDGETIELNVINQYSDYLWHDQSRDSIYNITGSGTYFVEVINECGMDRDTIVIWECDLFIPNAFTPNADGTNDMFGVFSTCELLNYSMKIFNRWGGLIFNSDNPKRQWDGTVKGTQLIPGTYVYKFTFQFQGKEKQIKAGEIVLFR